MAGIWATCACTPMWCNTSWNSNPTAILPTNSTQFRKIQRGLASPSSPSSPHSSLKAYKLPSFSSKPSASASSSAAVGSDGYIEEPATNVKFQTSLIIPGSSKTLSLLGTGQIQGEGFAFVGVKVYAAGFYVNPSVLNTLTAWKGQSASEIQENSALFSSIFQAPSEKSLQIVLVRDVDGKTFWDALDGAISPRIKVPTSVDESALSTFRGIFQGRSLNKGTLIFLTWLDPSKMLVSVSSNGMPSGVDATIESANVTSALFDVFFGDSPVSPSLKVSVASGLSTIL